MKIQQASLFLALVLAAPAFVLADNVPGHSRSGNTYVTYSEGFSEQQDSPGGSARCNFLLSSIKRNGIESASFARASFSGFARSDKNANFERPLNAGAASDSDHIGLLDFGGNQGASSDKDHGKADGNHNGGDGDKNEKGSGGGAPPLEIAVPEPGSQTLLLFGLAAVGVLFYRRKTLTDAI